MITNHSHTVNKICTLMIITICDTVMFMRLHLRSLHLQNHLEEVEVDFLEVGAILCYSVRSN